MFKRLNLLYSWLWNKFPKVSLNIENDAQQSTKNGHQPATHIVLILEIFDKWELIYYRS